MNVILEAKHIVNDVKGCAHCHVGLEATAGDFPGLDLSGHPVPCQHITAQAPTAYPATGLVEIS